MLTILLLAAGHSSRMRGGDKLMEEIDGVPLIKRMAERALSTGSPVIVALPVGETRRAKTLAGLGITPCPVPDADKGMARSIRAGVAMLPTDCSAVMILPADMPDLDRADLTTMQEAHTQAAPDRILRGATPDGHPGHPVIFPKQDFPTLLTLSGDQGARDILKANAHRVQHVPLPAQHALTDLDTPEDWENWREGRV